MKLIEMKNHFYTKGIRPLRITACGGYIGCYGGSRDPDLYPKPGCGLITDMLIIDATFIQDTTELF